jgi:Family of unknown function (DUF6491)
MWTSSKVGRLVALSAALGAACAGLGGCASGLPRAPGGDALGYLNYAGAPVEEFTTFRLDSWQAVSRNQLVLWSDVNKAYLLQVWDTCPDLQFAQRIRVTSTAYTISHAEYVRVGRDRCPITAIRPIDLKKMNQDRVAAKLAG